ncbi:MAG: acyltransferase [Bacteroidia bacterium]
MKRNFGLDLLRAISIWLVLLQHAGINLPGLKPLKIGGIGVEIFFVISGFLIGGILFKEIDKKNNLIKTLKSFWVRRWFRILPLYYLMLFIKFIFIDDSIGWNILYYVFFLQNNFYGINYFDVSWSLVIEEWFYLFSPIFLYFSLHFLKKDRLIIYSIVTFIALVVLLRSIYVFRGNVPYEGVNGNFPFRFDSLFIGVLLSYLNYKKLPLFQILKSKGVFLCGVALFCGYLFYYWSLAFPDDLINQRYFPRTIGFLILPLSIGLTIPFISELTVSNWKRPHIAFIVKTSILTYAIYLIHPFIYSKVLNTELINSFFIRFILSIIITYGLALITYQWFEKPILKYRDKITGYNKNKNQ